MSGLWNANYGFDRRIVKVTQTWRPLVIISSVFLGYAFIHGEPHVERLTTFAGSSFLFRHYIHRPLCVADRRVANHKLNTLSLKLEFFHSLDANPYDSRTRLCKHFLPSEVRRRFFVGTALSSALSNTLLNYAFLYKGFLEWYKYIKSENSLIR